MPHSIAPLLNIFSITRHKSPYPGLRPFGEGERDVFFGRDSQIREVIERLRANHFAAILGGSGSGKSSLVRAGVIPDLRSHALPGSDHWLPIIFTPGEAPIERLAERLQAQLALADDVRPEDVKLDIEDLLLQTRPFARFLECFQGSIRFDEEGLEALGAQTNLLVVVDQFEEIFRPQTVNSAQAKALVRLIIETFQQPHPRVYLVLTMRTEFLDHCAGSLELPDVLNATSYLTRRLNRAELEEVIVEPAKRYLVQLMRDAGQKPEEADAAWPFAPAVKRRLLNDVALMSDDTDHLPLLQHCLYRLWKAAEPRWQAGGRINSVPIEIADLEAAVGVGGGEKDSLLRRCLANHADAIYCSLTPARQKIAAEMFKLLAEVDEQGIHKRRWTTPQEIKEVTGADLAVVDDIVRKFSDPHPYIRCEGASPTRSIDVSHESFIRNWRRFRQWLEDDRALVACYEKLLQESQDWQRQMEATAPRFWRPLGLKYLLDQKIIDRFVDENYMSKITLPWARRYYHSLQKNLGENYQVDDKAHEIAIYYFNESKYRRKRHRISVIGMRAVLLSFFVSIPWLSWYLWSNSEERAWLAVETRAFQPYAVASAIAGPALQEREEWRPTRLWQAAVALRALEKLEDDVEAIGESGFVHDFLNKRMGIESRRYRLERARRLAHSVSHQTVQDIVGSTVWRRAGAPVVAEPAGARANTETHLPPLTPEDQSCVDAVLNTPGQQVAELVRANIGNPHGKPLLIRYGQENAYRLAFGIQTGDTCAKLEQMPDTWSHLVYAPDLAVIITSKQIQDPELGERFTVFSVYRLNWYTYCEVRPDAPCRRVWRLMTRPTGVLVRGAGAVANMNADGRSFYVQSGADPSGREWFAIAGFDGPERLDADEVRRIKPQFDARAIDADAFGTDEDGRQLLYLDLDTQPVIFETLSEDYRIVATAEDSGYLVFASSGIAAPRREGDSRSSGARQDSHYFTVLRVATTNRERGDKEILEERLGDATQLNFIRHPIATFDFFGPSIEEMMLGTDEDSGLVYFKTEGDLYYRAVWGTGQLRQRVCGVLAETGLDPRIEEAISPTFTMVASQEDGVINDIVTTEGPCPTRH
jgi:hypothetical protein